MLSSGLSRLLAAAAIGAVLGAGSVLTTWRPWLAPPPRVAITGPVTLEPRVVYEIATAQPERLRPTGETVTVPVQEPATPAVRRQLERRFGELEQLGSILGEAELGRLAYGGHAVISQTEAGGPLTLALAASR